MNKDLLYSASIMCANLLRLEGELAALEAAGCDELHFDVMDGQFVPNITLGFDFIKAVRSYTSLPCSAHLMIERPERYIERFVEAGCHSVTVHVEACTHAHRVLNQIKAAGATSGIAINPATALTKLDYLLDSADRVLVMAVDPGFTGQTILKGTFDRVRILHENLRYRKLDVRIEVDGNITVRNAAILANLGASILDCGTSSIFDGRPPGEALADFREKVALERKIV
ncbi:MAG TPA: ribulose-phosphate 3-epimerase [Candidatus Hydrogenedentes bacterium]|nr:ribulose-phosphate 3-epimerase [Candidatus Hydrogenedentota bacterium]HPJ99431.1 ribulose-phosphate 3-epimerase [Candidatus Hydrogenedentota bacterium]